MCSSDLYAVQFREKRGGAVRDFARGRDRIPEKAVASREKRAVDKRLIAFQEQTIVVFHLSLLRLVNGDGARFRALQKTGTAPDAVFGMLHTCGKISLFVQFIADVDQILRTGRDASLTAFTLFLRNSDSVFLTHFFSPPGDDYRK